MRLSEVWKADAAWMMETMLATLAQGLAADDQQKFAPRFRRATKEEAEAKLNLVWGIGGLRLRGQVQMISE